MSVAGKEDDNAGAEEASQWPKLSENVKEEVVVLKEGDIVGGEIKEEKGDQNVTRENEEGECSSDAKGAETFLENGLFLEMKSYEKKALVDLRSRLEDAILTNKLFKKAKRDEGKRLVEDEEGKEKQDSPIEGKREEVEERKEEQESVEEKGKAKEEEIVEKDVSLWGVPLLPSKEDERTDVVLMKFLRARDYRAGEALEMLKKTLEWRKENRMDSILEEDLGGEFDRVGYMKGVDREGHPVCYNVYGVFADEEMYNKTFGSEAGRERFLRWRLQLLEREIRNLDFQPKGVSTLLQINDLKDTPGPSRRDLRLATKRALLILQENYPELVAKNIFVNVPFWYYAFNALFSAFLTQRTKSKFVFSRPSRVTDTLVKYIAAEEIAAAYGGLRKEDDPNFSTCDAASELIVKAGFTETIEIPVPEVGHTLIWDVMIVGWDVSYKEEFVPTDEGSYTVIVKKGRRISWQQESIRNSFVNKEAGKLVITIENGMFKKKRVLYRYKTNQPDIRSCD